MVQRKDALAAAAEWITAVETLTRAADPHLVATVGCIECLPGAVNVIPGEVRLTLDVRGPQDAQLAPLLTALLAQAQAICVRRGVRFASEEFYRIDATACDSELQQCWQAAVEQVQGAAWRCRAAPGMTPSPWRRTGRSACCSCVAPAASAIIRPKRCGRRTWRWRSRPIA